MGNYPGTLLFGLALLFGMPAHGQAGDTAAAGPLLGQEPQLRALLQQEMQALQQALGSISEALPEGDWQNVAATAKQMRDSFIFQQQLGEQERRTLKRVLPPGFIRQDRAFHRLADKLHRAAGRHDAELSLFYYSKMLESCVSCHSQYARQRFPALSGDRDAVHVH